MHAERMASHSMRQVTIAFHFRYIMAGELLDSNAVAVRLLERVLRIVHPHSSEVGSVLVRMGHLISLKHLYGARASALVNSFSTTDKSRFYPGRQRHLTERVVPIDRIYVVTLSGRLSGVQKSWSQQLRRYRSHPFLFGLDVDVNNPALEWIYLRQNVVIGEFAPDGRMILDWDSLGFEDDLPQMLKRLNLTDCLSHVALRTSLRLFGES